MKRILSLMLACVLLLGCVFALASCNTPAKDPEAAAKALEAAEYTANYYVQDEATEEGITGYLQAYKLNEDNEIEEFIYVVYFEDSQAAKEYYDDNEEDITEAGEYYKTILGEDIEIEVRKSGKLIWIGTEQAVKDAK